MPCSLRSLMACCLRIHLPESMVQSKMRGFAMCRLRLFGIVSLAVLAFGAVASSASALLPAVLFLSGTTSVLLAGSKSGANVAHFGNLFYQLEAKGIKIELTVLTNDTHLGKVIILLSEAKINGEGTCQNEGLGAGDLRLTGEWHLVYTGLGALLNVGLLVLVPLTKFKCGESSLSIEGSSLLTLQQGSVTEGDITEIGSKAECEGGSLNRAVHPKYENEAGSVVEASLIGVVAGIREKECWAISGEIVLKGQMFKIDL
jgi:hypothetical protein